MPKSVSYSLKHTDSLLRDLGPNTVAGQSCNFDEHQKLTSVIPKSPAESERERDLTSDGMTAKFKKKQDENAASHSPKIIFLLGLMFRHRSRGKADRTKIRRNSTRKESVRILCACRNRLGVFRFNSRRRNAVALAIGLAN